MRNEAGVLLIFLLLSAVGSFGQGGRSQIDSLESVYTSGGYDGQQKIAILRELAIHHPDPERKLFFSEELIQTAQSLDAADYLVQGYLEKGNALRLKSDLTQALETFFQAAKIVGEENQSSRLGSIYIGIADVYSIMGNHANAVKYHQSAIRILREEGDSVNIASALLNAGDEYITAGKLDSALIYTEEAGFIFEKLKSPLGEAYSLGNLGMIYAQMGDDRKAEEHMNMAVNLLEEMDEYYPIAVYLTYIADIYLNQHDYKTALSYAFRSLELARRYQLKNQISEANLKISEIYERSGRISESFRYFKDHIAYKDSVKDYRGGSANG